jgi:hypothetical protein
MLKERARERRGSQQHGARTAQRDFFRERPDDTALYQSR